MSRIPTPLTWKRRAFAVLEVVRVVRLQNDPNAAHGIMPHEI